MISDKTVGAVLWCHCFCFTVNKQRWYLIFLFFRLVSVFGWQITTTSAAFAAQFYFHSSAALKRLLHLNGVLRLQGSCHRRRWSSNCHAWLQLMLHVNVPHLGGVDSALLEGAAAGVVGAQVAIFAPVTAEGAVDAWQTPAGRKEQVISYCIHFYTPRPQYICSHLYITDQKGKKKHVTAVFYG